MYVFNSRLDFFTAAAKRKGEQEIVAAIGET